MESKIPSADIILKEKVQMISLMDEMIDQKKLLFQQLMTGIDTLRTEISDLEEKRKTVTLESAENSLKDCLY